QDFMAQLVLYVDPQRGRNDSDGQSPAQALPTLTAALRLSQGDTLIRLAEGQYTESSGERFPLIIPPGCVVQGTVTGDRPATTIQGGDTVQHPLLGRRSVTCQLMDEAALQTVNVSNPQSQGIGIWLATGRPRLQKVMVRQCGQHGAIALEQALPLIQDCLFEQCGVAGLVFITQSKGQLERVFSLNNGIGLLLQDGAAPLVLTSSFERCDTGIKIADTAQPVLRSNRVNNNRTYGLHLIRSGTADFGQSQDEGKNVVRQNGQLDILNETGRSLVSCGNDLLPPQLRGSIDLIASELPDASAVPARLLNQPANFPEPDSNAGSQSLTPEPSAPAVGSARFVDTTDHWAGAFVDGLVQAGTVAGFPNGTFRPEQVVSRAEFAAFVRASFPSRPQTRSPKQFFDLAPEFWAYDALNQAYVTGFLSGYPDGTMRPGESIPRIQAMVAVANGLGLAGGRSDDIGIYRDRAQVPSYAVNALATATRQRLVVNYPEPLVLRPMEPMTRSELSALIYQGRVAMGRASHITSPYIVQPDTTQPMFSDLEQHWAADFVQGLTAINLVSGLEDGRFAPDATISRAEFATLLANAFAPKPIRPAATFADVPPDFWAASAIQAAYRGNFMAGFPDQAFEPAHPLLRVQIWVALVNGLYDVDERSRLSNLEKLARFQDHLDIPTYGTQQTAIALSQRLIAAAPDSNRLYPNRVATRADASVAVYQALVAQGRLPTITSQYVL
ncbi:MAG: S-layer homology domain-containing protein, partial [Cyanobacteria bacterium P01_D01_bin.71]